MIQSVIIYTHCSGVFKGYTRLSCNGGTMQECKVCGLLFLGGGACPTCGSQVATDIDTDDIVMDDENIPGLDEIAEAIGDDISEDSSEVLPFGMGAKAEVMESSLPFGVGSYTSDIDEPSMDEEETSLDESTVDSDSISEPMRAQSFESLMVENTPEDDVVDEETEIGGIETVESEINIEYDAGISEAPEITTDEPQPLIGSQMTDQAPITEPDEPTDFESPTEAPPQFPETNEAIVESEIEYSESIVNDIPDMWRIDAAEVDMEAIYAQEEQVVEVSFDENTNDDVMVTFDDFHHSPVEESMASDDDAPELHPAKALAVDSAGQPEIASMVESSFEAMANSSWMQAAQILSTASNNRQNDPAILNNLGLALLQSALEMDSLNDPMSESQYEAAIMALRQGAKIDSQNNTILLNLSHALLVSGRAEKALKVINVLRSRLTGDIEVENVFGACLIQLGRDEEAESILRPYSSDAVVRANLDLI